MRVRAGTLADVPWLCEQLRAFASCYPVRLPIYGEDAYVESLVGTLIREQYLSVAEDESGNAVGLIAGLYQSHPFNPDLKLVSELWWWVVPEARGSRAGSLLLRDLERWADEMNAPLALTLEANTALSDDTLARRGYVPVERQFLRLPGGIA